QPSAPSPSHRADWYRCRRRPRPSPRSRRAARSRLASRAPLAARARLAPRRPEHGAAAAHRTTAAGEYLIDVGRIGLVAPDLIIVGQLLTGLDGAQGLDEHAPIVDG